MAEKERSPHVRRFLISVEKLIRVWAVCLGVGLVLTALGLVPSFFAVAGLMGLAWVPVFLLIYWGRLLQDMGFCRNGRDEPW